MIKSACNDLEVAIADEESKYKVGKESSLIGEILCPSELSMTESSSIGLSFSNPSMRLSVYYLRFGTQCLRYQLDRLPLP